MNRYRVFMTSGDAFTRWAPTEEKAAEMALENNEGFVVSHVEEAEATPDEKLERSFLLIKYHYAEGGYINPSVREDLAERHGVKFRHDPLTDEYHGAIYADTELPDEVLLDLYEAICDDQILERDDDEAAFFANRKFELGYLHVW